MQTRAGVGEARDEILVQLDTQAGLGWGNDVAVFPAYRFLQDPGVEAVPALDAFEDQEVGAAGGELDVGSAYDRSAIQVRGDLHVIDLCHAGNLLGLEKAA